MAKKKQHSGSKSGTARPHRQSSAMDPQTREPKAPTNAPTAGDLVETPLHAPATVSRMLVALAIAFLFLAALAALLPYLTSSQPAEIRAEFSELGDVEVQYATAQSDGFSPVCGCMAEQSYQQWRGITTVARHVELHRSGDTPLAAYLITGAFPEPITWQPNVFRFKYRLFQIYLQGPDAFDPAAVLSGKFPKLWSVTEMENSSVVDFLALRTSAPLNVSLLGPKPILAWIPSRGSSVLLDYSTGMHVKSSRIRQITEKHPGCEKDFDPDSLEYPLVDALGPNVVLWTVDGDAVVTDGKSIFVPPPSQRKWATQITALLIEKPPFATRIAMQAWDTSSWNRYQSMILERTPTQLPLLGNHCQDIGTAYMRILEDSDPSPLYTKVRNEIARDDIAAISNIPAKLPGSDSFGAMTFRHPPIPETPGLAVFGALRNVKLSGAIGKLWAGTKLVELPTSSELEFRNMEFFRTPVGSMTVPHPAQQGAGKVAFRVQKASGELFLNGKPLHIRADSYRHLSEAFQQYNVLLALVAAVAGVLTLLIAFFRRA